MCACGILTEGRRGIWDCSSSGSGICLGTLCACSGPCTMREIETQEQQATSGFQAFPFFVLLSVDSRHPLFRDPDDDRLHRVRNHRCPSSRDDRLVFESSSPVPSRECTKGVPSNPEDEPEPPKTTMTASSERFSPTFATLTKPEHERGAPTLSTFCIELNMGCK